MSRWILAISGWWALAGILAGEPRLASALAQESEPSQRPNIVVILTDDQGWGDLSLHGNSNLNTPHIDSLARDGAQFERFYVCPVCSPTRAEFLTGRYHPRGGVYSTSSGGERLDLDETTIADAFQAAGYATAAFGKWHNGMQYPYHPNGRGFEEFYGFCSGHWGHYFSPLLEHNGQLTQGAGFCIDDFTDRALAFIEQHREQPFFVYLPYNTPHSPMQVPDPWWSKFQDKDLEMRHRDPAREQVEHTRAALAMCENIDANVGRLLAKLEQSQLAERTIVVFFCDNGPNGFRWNGGMKGRKGSTDEGGVRSPLLVRWPGQIAGGTTISENAAAIDLFPTLAALAKVPPTNKLPLDGIRLDSLLLGDATTLPNRFIYSHWNGRVAVRAGRFVLDHQGRLFDLQQDGGQQTDISQRRPELTRQLRDAADQWKRDVLTGHEQDQRPFLVGHPSYRYTQLPARDATSTGGIQRSNRFPNCSYFTNWTSTEDRIRWDIEVLAEGEYDVELYYTCPSADVGSEVQLEFNGQSVRGQLTEPHDSPLIGGDQDRVPRQESYVKDFRSWKLGTIRLPAGRGSLSLSAPTIPGQQVMDFRLLMLTRR